MIEKIILFDGHGTIVSDDEKIIFKNNKFRLYENFREVNTYEVKKYSNTLVLRKEEYDDDKIINSRITKERSIKVDRVVIDVKTDVFESNVITFENGKYLIQSFNEQKAMVAETYVYRKDFWYYVFVYDYEDMTFLALNSKDDTTVNIKFSNLIKDVGDHYIVPKYAPLGYLRVKEYNGEKITALMNLPFIPKVPNHNVYDHQIYIPFNDFERENYFKGLKIHEEIRDGKLIRSYR